MIPNLVIVGHTTHDEIVTPNAHRQLPGGAAYFGALAASRLSDSVGLVSAIGEDFINTSLLTNRGLTEGIKIVPDQPTMSIKVTYNNENDPTDRTLAVNWGAAEQLTPQDIPTQWFNSERMHIAIKTPRIQQKFIQHIRESGYAGTLSVDTELSFLQDEEARRLAIHNFQQCDEIFMNRAEYELIQGQLHRDQSILGRNILLKLDRDGAQYIDSNGEVVAHAIPKPVDAIDTTGAGDVFAGTYLAERVKGQSIQQSLESAVSVASLSVTKEGIMHIFDETAPRSKERF